MDTISEQAGRAGGASANRRLARAGLLTAAVYLATALFYARGFQGYTRTAREVFIWLAVLPLLYLFWRGYRVVRDAGDGVKVSTVVALAGLFCVLCVFVYPFHSTDVFGYINRGWQQVHYHMNPYVHTVAEVPGWRADPMIWEHWIYNPNPYGFLFTLLARGLTHLGGGNWLATLLLFKLANASAYALTGRLVWSGAKHLGHPRPVLALYSFLWNPLILMHHLANGHNDILVGCLLALAVYAVVRGREVWVLPALAAATMLKYAPALLVPAALVYVFKKRGWKTAAVGCVLAAAVVVACAAPYLADWRAFRLEDIRDNATLIDNSLHSFLIHVFENMARLAPALAPLHGAADAAIRLSLRGGFAVFLLFVYVRFLRGVTGERLVELTTLVMVVLLLVATSKLNGWYMGILLPPALFLPERHWLRRLTLLVTCAQTLSLTFFKQAYMLNYFAMVIVPAFLVYRQARGERASEGYDRTASVGERVGLTH
ncbi:MAG TPA: glycosyltransferase 87 family protein [Pyrinomonadaceae bacterium]|nr:glycosyltransferase 87 family protein [Pyrinomonadaceae bacterium]